MSPFIPVEQTLARVAGGMSTIAAIFSESGQIPDPSITWPKNLMLLFEN